MRLPWGGDEAAPSANKVNEKGVYKYPVSDRTHRIALGGTVKVAYDTGNANVGVNGVISSTGKVKVFRQVTVSPHFLSDGNNKPITSEPFIDNNFDGIWKTGEPFLDLDGDRKYTEKLTAADMMKRFDRDLVVANEVYAQVGVRLVKGTGANTGIIQAPVAIIDGTITVDSTLPVTGDASLTPSMNALLVGGTIPAPANNNPIAGKFNTASNKDVEVYYVMSIFPDNWERPTPLNPPLRGVAFSSASYRSMKTTDLNDTILLSNTADYYTLAHELYHILGQIGRHYADPWNVFRNAPTQILDDLAHLTNSDDWIARITDSRRLTQGQQGAIKESKYAENPT